jgi:biotin carboxyl carrier protein
MKKLRVTIDGVTYDVEVEVLADDEDDGYGYSATNIYSNQPTVRSAPPPPAAARPAAAAPASPPPAAGGGSKTVTSPLPGIVKSIKVKVGDSFAANAPLVVLEAMKMETVISSTSAGVVKEIKVTPSQSVQQDEVLVVFE